MSTSQMMNPEKLREKYVFWWVVTTLTVPVTLDFFLYGTQMARLSRVLIFAGIFMSLLINQKLFLKSKIASAYSLLGIATLWAIGTFTDLSKGGVATPNFALLLLFLFIISANIDLYEKCLDATMNSFHFVTALSALAILLKLNPRSYFANSGGFTIYLDFIGIPGRNYGILPHPNSLGQVAAVSLLILITSKANKFLWLVPILCIAKSGSRTALIGLALALIVYLTIYIFKKNKSKGKSVVLESPITIGIFLVGIFLTSTAQFISIINVLDPNALTARVSIWQNALTIFQQNLILGTGWGWESRGIEARLINVWATSAHNAILDIVFSAGFAGLLIFLILLVKTLVYFNFLLVQERLIFCFLLASGVSETFVDLQYPTLQTYIFFLIVIGSNRKASIINE
jgi:O-antigen ligase